MTKWYETSCASKILKWYIPPFSSTAFINLEKNWWLMIGKTNCDQFWMWSSTENTIFGPTINPYGTNRIAGWSSGWSTVAVATDLCLWALWTDTGGSCRQPASLCNIVWLKPTYGRVSRYGVNAYASSFDQIWTLTKTVEDAKILLSSIDWFDDKDATSVQRNDHKDRDKAFTDFNIKWKKIAVPNQFFGEWLDPKVKTNILETVNKLEKKWAIVEYIDFPILDNVLSMYYILTTAELSTNLSRLDGMRYWLQYDSSQFENIQAYYKKIRTDWFLKETRRRILTWTFVLNSDNYEGYYLKALKARKLLQQEFEKLFKQYDCIVWPVSPEIARKIWDNTKKDPVKMYLADIYTVTSNLAQNCSMSVPNGFIEDQWEQMPVWIQIIADKWKEDMLFGIGNVIEKLDK